MSQEEKRQHWRAVVDSWRSSGETKAAFCRQHGIAQWKFHYWLKRLDQPTALQSEPAFARVESVDGTGISLRLGGGNLRLCLEPGFDPATLRQFLTVVSTLPC